MPLSEERRPKVVLDTNVLVSALFWQGLEADVVELVEDGRVRGYTSPSIIEELRHVLSYPRFGLETEEVEEACNYYITILTVVVPETKIDLIREDPEDNKVIECALRVGAKFIVTGDRHLLGIHEHGSSKIVNAQQLLGILMDRSA